MKAIHEKLADLARTPVLLVASDYDGTLSPIVSDPAAARPLREGLVALRMLAALPSTHVAVISGRSLRDLSDLLGETDGVHLVGSHGGEFDLDFARGLSPETSALRDRVLSELMALADSAPGFLVEEKPASVAFHYRNAEPDEAARAVAEVLAGPAALEGVQTRQGKMVVELSVVPTDKGRAIDTLRRRLGAAAVVYFGDDLTDEDAFATLRGPDVGVKVGDGDTRAEISIDDPTEVARALARLAELRDDWLSAHGAVPIEGHSLLSDQRALALVTPDARLTWMCLPRLDSAALFADLLGGPMAGHFSIRPADGGAPTGQGYEGNSLVLRTEWPGFAVTDFLDCSHGRTRRRAGRSDLVRILEGKGRVVIEFAPRLDYGRIPTRLVRHEHGLRIEGALDPIVLRAPNVEWEIAEDGPHEIARVELELDGIVVFDLRYGTASLSDLSLLGGERRDLTHAYWSNWSAHLTLPAVEPELVMRSALALKGLCYAPTGAVAAAATTSLPEGIGGVRNWDYRFSWLRDAALSTGALLALNSRAEAMQFLDWVLAIVDAAPSPTSLQPLYCVDGEPVAPDAEIGELSGYMGSRPVRVGNSAAFQVQLDVFGPIVELVHDLLVAESPLSMDHWRLVEAMATAVLERWEEPDHGIWEVRSQRRHHVHSKVMCWTTLDRAVRIARTFLEEERTEWAAVRDRIAAEVLERGWNPRRNAFTAAYDSDELDAAVLQIGLSGLVDGTDPRFQKTVEAIERELLDGPTVYRYLYDDGLPGKEGGFHLCASWLVDSYVLVGRTDDAWRLFREITALAGPTGLLPEQYDPESKRSLGNHPQAYSHLGVIQNAVRLSAIGRPPGSA